MPLLALAAIRNLARSAPPRAALATSFVLAVVGASAPALGQQPYQQVAPPGEYIPDDDGSEAQDVPVGVSGDEYADTDPSALTDFRSTLDPHGTWVDDPTYGQIWVPNAEEVGANFAPYVTEGSWAYEEDYVWISNYAWGWVPFHYGRWAWTAGRWGWVPGRVYAGAWVSWRTGADGYGYLGWGPMAPAFGWRGGVACGLGAGVASRPGPYVFVGREWLFATRVAERVVVGEQMATIAAGTRPYVRSEPVLQGRPAAQGIVHGPPPTALGIPQSLVVRVDPSNLNLARARAYARPSTAQAIGARPPVAHRFRTRSGAGGGAGAIHGGPVREVRPMPAPQAPAARPVVRGGGGGGRRH